MKSFLFAILALSALASPAFAQSGIAPHSPPPTITLPTNPIVNPGHPIGCIDPIDCPIHPIQPVLPAPITPFPIVCLNGAGSCGPFKPLPVAPANSVNLNTLVNSQTASAVNVQSLMNASSVSDTNSF